MPNNNFWGDFYQQAIEGLGLGDGASAAKTAGNVLKDLTSAPAPNLPAASVTAPTAIPHADMMKYAAIAVAGVALYLMLKD